MRAAKAGPDYIDPAFHAAATGAPSLNLDSWAMAPALLDALACEAAQRRRHARHRGRDGPVRRRAAPPGRSGSTADLAARFGLPVLLVLDVSGQSQTAAAVARGLAMHDPAVRIAGVVLNRVGSERHQALVADAMAPAGMPVLGAVPRDPGLATPERHLGLVQAGEHADLAERLDRLADMAERDLDLDGIVAAAGAAEAVASGDGITGRAAAAAGATDRARRRSRLLVRLSHVVDGWRRAGAEIVAFSPLADEPPPADCDSCWLPGGYPELHAGALAAARRFRDGLARFAATRPVHGECGGYMVLGAGLEDADGTRHEMAGLLGHETSFAERKLHLGYREARLIAASALGPAGGALRGHEFHYATVTHAGNDAPLARARRWPGRGARPIGRPARPCHRRVLPRHRAGVTG